MSVKAKAMGILGIEGGGTKTTWALLTPDGKVLAQGTAGPGNSLLLKDGALEKLFRGIFREVGPRVTAIGGAFAGCQLAPEKARVEQALRRVWPKAGKVRMMEDTRSALAAAFGDGPGIVVIAGTGSNIVGQKSSTLPLEKAGGWGHLFSDHGSAYDLARRGLELAYARYDHEAKTSPLAQEFLAAAGKRNLEELVPFLLHDLSKTSVAQMGAVRFFCRAKRRPRRALLLDEATDDPRAKGRHAGAANAAGAAPGGVGGRSL